MSKNTREGRYPALKCSICGNPIDFGEYSIREKIPQIMFQKNLCWECAYWEDKVDNPDPQMEIIDGCYYIFQPWVYMWTPDPFRQDNRQYYAVRNDKTLVRTNNAITVGRIPERFREKLPNTARLVKRKTWNLLKKNGGTKCSNKGCWDRYHCFFYDLDTEKENGPWNIVPNNHKVGSEKCPIFVNKDAIYI